ncbi:MAG: nuclear transport factor 2 family protein [Gammaproteobacteria bacterium]|nr:MAG: nuclear transport factor 2 family protein [Gammaproteobacteria bacterium]
MTSTLSATGKSHSNNPQVTLDRFQSLFNEMKSGRIGDLASVYAEHVSFTDPLGTVVGRDRLSTYLEESYRNVLDCRFEFKERVTDGAQACLTWRMLVRHKRLNGGRAIEVDGISHLELRGDLIVFHRDYFDLGQLLYGNVPLLGRVIRWLRRQAV